MVQASSDEPGSSRVAIGQDVDRSASDVIAGVDPEVAEALLALGEHLLVGHPLHRHVLGVVGDREVSSIPDTEPMTDGRIEAGKLIYEILSAALEPYPRKPGVEFDWVDPKLKDAGDQGPFAALAKLKRET